MTILGIVAAITVPSLARKQVEKSNRVKIKKAMAAFDKFVQQAKIENNLQSISDFGTFKSTNNCENAYKYFKAIDRDSEKPCILKTGDGLWWDFTSNIFTRGVVYVSTKKDDLKLTATNLQNASRNFDNNNTFAFTVSVDENGAFRVNDLAYEMSKCNYASLPPACQRTYKLYNYLNNEKLPDAEAISTDDKVVTRNCNNSYGCSLSTNVEFKNKTRSSYYKVVGNYCDMYGNNCSNYQSCENKEYYPYCTNLTGCDNEGNGCSCVNPNSAYCGI